MCDVPSERNSGSVVGEGFACVAEDFERSGEVNSGITWYALYVRKENLGWGIQMSEDPREL